MPKIELQSCIQTDRMNSPQIQDLVMPKPKESTFHVICRLFGETLSEFLPLETPKLFSMRLIKAEHVVWLARWPHPSQQFPRLRRVIETFQAKVSDALSNLVRHASITQLSLHIETYDRDWSPSLSELKTLVNLQKLQLQSCGAPDGIETLSSLQELHIRSLIKSIAKIVTLANLRVLRLDACVGSLARIGQLVNLRSLHLASGGTALKPLAALTQLQSLWLGHEKVDLTPVAALIRLEVLTLTMYNGDITPVASLTNLRSLSLFAFKGDIWPLRRLTKLQVLDLPSFDGDLSALWGMARLLELNLNSQRASILPVAGLTKLRFLFIRQYSGSLHALTDLTKLEHLDLDSRSWDAETLQHLAKLDEKCKIDHRGYRISRKDISKVVSVNRLLHRQDIASVRLTADPSKFPPEDPHPGRQFSQMLTGP